MGFFAKRFIRLFSSANVFGTILNDCIIGGVCLEPMGNCLAVGSSYSSLLTLMQPTPSVMRALGAALVMHLNESCNTSSLASFCVSFVLQSSFKAE